MKKTVVLTAGHGGSDCGAVAKDGTTEASVATDMRNIIAAVLKEKGIGVITDGTGRENKPLRDAVKLIPLGDIAIELHCNAAADPRAGGVEVLSRPKHKPLAQKLCKAVSSTMGIKIRGSEGGYRPENSGQHSRLAYVSGGGVILELFFISNPAELKIYREKAWTIARSIVDAIIEYLGE